MKRKRRQSIALCSTLVAAFAFVIIVALIRAAASYASESTVHHDLQIELIPSESTLKALDTVALAIDDHRPISIRLAAHAGISMLEVNGKQVPYTFSEGELAVPLPHDQDLRTALIVLAYACIYNDPVPVQPVNTDNPGYGVSGTITPTGTLLLSGAGWYPELTGRRSRFTITVTAPEGILAVTTGKPLGHTTENGKTLSRWYIEQDLNGLSLSAARYELQGKKLGDTVVSTYFFPESSFLAHEYLEAAMRSIALYERLFGPYAFDKFSIVENFFSTGFGFPSYTLIGSDVLRLPFIIQTSLGHEIAHCWWGNGVLVDYEQGNWSEALTTYVADYLYKEQRSAAEAMEYRRQMLRNYASLVGAEDDLALVQFRSRINPVTKTIGYDKGAMVFHMVRREIGDQAFWQALRNIYASHRFEAISWKEFEQEFEYCSGASLSRFFDQWVQRPGAPKISLAGVTMTKTGNNYAVSGRLVQVKPYYHLDVPLVLDTDEAPALVVSNLTGAAAHFTLHTPFLPQRLTVDPEYEVLRRLYPSEIPATVNSLKGSKALIMVLPSDHIDSMQRVARYLQDALGMPTARIIAEDQLSERDVTTSDLLFIGIPTKKTDLIAPPEAIHWDEKKLVIGPSSYDRSNHGFLVLFDHPRAAAQIIGVFMPQAPPLDLVVARKIPHYGQYSYLVFHNENNIVKGTWTPQAKELVYQW